MTTGPFHENLSELLKTGATVLRLVKRQVLATHTLAKAGEAAHGCAPAAQESARRS